MHLHANRKVGRAGLVILGFAIAAAAYFHSLWFIAGGLALWVATYFFVIQSCVRFVNRSIGMPPNTQAHFSELYKTDQNFARDVDKLANGAAKNENPDEPIDIEKMNHDVWTDQLAGIVDELGANNPEIKICVYPEHTYDPETTPLFTVRPDDLQGTLSRLRTDFGGGVFWLIVFVRGQIRRRFTLYVKA